MPVLAVAELAAVALAVAYLVLAIRQQPLCWPAGALSAVLYAAVLWEARLFLESWLQGFYVAMAAYGWWQWRHGAHGDPLRVMRGRWQRHALLLGAVAVLTLVAGTLLARHSVAALPFADAAITFASLVATWLTARKWLESWYWWFGIDAASVAVYLERGLNATAALFSVYLVLVVIGYRSWRRTLVAAS